MSREDAGNRGMIRVCSFAGLCMLALAGETAYFAHKNFSDHNETAGVFMAVLAAGFALVGLCGISCAVAEIFSTRCCPTLFSPKSPATSDQKPLLSPKEKSDLATQETRVNMAAQNGYTGPAKENRMVARQVVYQV